MGLRRPQNFKGIRRGYVNIGNDLHPYWIKIQEKYPIVNENIVIPNNDNEKNNITNIIFTRTFTENISRNMFNNTLSSFNNNNNNLNENSDFIKINRNIEINTNKTINLSKLDVKGKKLIDVEENIIKEMKGKKKRMVKFKYDKEMLKDLNIKEQWDYKGKIIN